MVTMVENSCVLLSVVCRPYYTVLYAYSNSVHQTITEWCYLVILIPSSIQEVRDKKR